MHFLRRLALYVILLCGAKVICIPHHNIISSTISGPPHPSDNSASITQMSNRLSYDVTGIVFNNDSSQKAEQPISSGIHLDVTSSAVSGRTVALVGIGLFLSQRFDFAHAEEIGGELCCVSSVFVSTHQQTDPLLSSVLQLRFDEIAQGILHDVSCLWLRRLFRI